MRGCLARTWGPLKIPEGLPDEKVVLWSDIFPTGYMGGGDCNIQQAIRWRFGAAGRGAQFAIRSAFMLGAERGGLRSTAFQSVLQMARDGGAETVTSRKWMLG